jgi:hypothetical protein
MFTVFIAAIVVIVAAVIAIWLAFRNRQPSPGSVTRVTRADDREWLETITERMDFREESERRAKFEATMAKIQREREARERTKSATSSAAAGSPEGWSTPGVGHDTWSDAGPGTPSADADPTPSVGSWTGFGGSSDYGGGGASDSWGSSSYSDSGSSGSSGSDSGGGSSGGGGE